MIIPFDQHSVEFKLLINRIRDILGSFSAQSQSNPEIFELLEGLYRLRVDSLNEEIRSIVKEGNYARTG